MTISTTPLRDKTRAQAAASRTPPGQVVARIPEKQTGAPYDDEVLVAAQAKINAGERLKEVAKRLADLSENLAAEVDYYRRHSGEQVTTFSVVDEFGRHAKSLEAIAKFAEADN